MPWYGSHPYLNDYISQHHCKRLMEIGVYTGENAVSMVETAVAHAPDPREVAYYGFDLFVNATSDQVRRKLERLGCTVALFEGDTLETLPGAVASLPQMDLIFIDAGKSFAEAMSDWQNAEQLAHDETGVFVHNARFPGVHRMLGQVSRELYRVEVFRAPSEGSVALITRS
ncbi:MAG: class I SAM-dependent methyltransferase [Anaerolineae bacterium]|nr:class I SAM-dependent methyltransferase [Anaerolineae bacterium]